MKGGGESICFSMEKGHISKKMRDGTKVKSIIKY